MEGEKRGKSFRGNRAAPPFFSNPPPPPPPLSSSPSWLSLVYLTLERVSAAKTTPSLGATVSPEISRNYGTFVYDVVNARKSGYTLETLKLEEMMRRSAEEKSEEYVEKDQMEAAILSQCMRLVFLTVTVLEEEEAAGEGPGPRIPGAT